MELRHDNQINKMNEVLGHICAHIGSPGPVEHPKDGEMNEMTLPSRHRIRDSSPSSGLRPHTYLLVTETPHNIEYFTSERQTGTQQTQNTSIRFLQRRPLYKYYTDVLCLLHHYITPMHVHTGAMRFLEQMTMSSTTVMVERVSHVSMLITSQLRVTHHASRITHS